MDNLLNITAPQSAPSAAARDSRVDQADHASSDFAGELRERSAPQKRDEANNHPEARQNAARPSRPDHSEKQDVSKDGRSVRPAREKNASGKSSGDKNDKGEDNKADAALNATAATADNTKIDKQDANAEGTDIVSLLNAVVDPTANSGTDTSSTSLIPQNSPLVATDPTTLAAELVGPEIPTAPLQPFINNTGTAKNAANDVLGAHLPEKLKALLQAANAANTPAATDDQTAAKPESFNDLLPEEVNDILSKIPQGTRPDVLTQTKNADVPEAAPVKAQNVIPEVAAKKANSILDVVKQTLTKNDSISIIDLIAQQQSHKASIPQLAEEKTPAQLLTELKPTIEGTTKVQVEAAVQTVTTASANLSSSGDDSDTLSNGNGSSNPIFHLSQEARAAATHNASESFSKLLNTTQHTPVADQVVIQIKNIAATGENKIKIQLDPVELGKVEIQMNVSADGKTTVSVTADNRNTLDVLQREVKQLEQALRDVGLKTDMGSLSFNLRGEQGQQQFARQKGTYTQVAALGEEDVDYRDAAIAMYQVNIRQGVDIRV